MRWHTRRNSLTPSTWTPKEGPAVFVTLTTSWGMPEHERYSFWRGLSQARWSETVQFREDLVHFTPVSDTVTRMFLETACSPPRLMRVLEWLVQEGCMTRATASRIENRLLASPWCDHWQVWQDIPADDQDLNRTINRYWR
jgi:hypothetical protein